MYYAITHLTLFKYSEPITDSVMQLCMKPLSDNEQRCHQFKINISPNARILNHRDYLENTFHTFDIPGRHQELAIKAESVVEIKPAQEIPARLEAGDWERLDAVSHQRDLYDMLIPSHFTQPTPLLTQFADELDVRRGDDPLTTLRELNGAIYNAFAYTQNVTRVDSPIDEALESRQGVCQDFSHIMIALVRSRLQMPCRYVSGYLFHRTDEQDRSPEDASHAWVQAWLPDLGWVGFDPTNNLICMDRHIRVGVGRDYADIPPTRGVFKGEADSALDVRVHVSRLDELPATEEEIDPDIRLPRYQLMTPQQQQQQQQ